MQILSKPFGVYETNCFILKTDGGEFIIDPGENSFEWIKANVQNPIAILNTHGHFDHVWDNAKVKELFNIPIYIAKDDAFMLNGDIFGFKMPPSKADLELNADESVNIGGIDVKFWHFPGHTPGCSVIELNGVMFSGDFVFKGSIGRVDFPYSKPEDMKKSINKFLEFTKDMDVYPGHGPKTTVNAEKQSLKSWLEYI